MYTLVVYSLEPAVTVHFVVYLCIVLHCTIVLRLFLNLLWLYTGSVHLYCIPLYNFQVFRTCFTVHFWVYTCVVLCVPCQSLAVHCVAYACFVLCEPCLEWEGPAQVRAGFDLYRCLCRRSAGSGASTLPSFVSVSLALWVRPSQQGTTGQEVDVEKGWEESDALSSVVLGQLVTWPTPVSEVFRVFQPL